eukprot:g1545.t1
MELHKTSEGVQECGCGALLNLAMNKKNRTCSAIQGGIAAVLRAMDSHKTDDGVQEYGCWALQNLAFSKMKREQLANQGGIAAILRAMESHKTSEGVQEHGCGALYSLTCNNVENKKRIAKEGGIAAILRAMDSHKTNEGVQKQGCGALRNLACKNAENKKQIAKEGGIAAILRAMESHKTNEDVQEKGCRALLNLAAKNAENKKRIAKEGGIAAILRAMESHRTNEGVQKEGCDALRNLAAGNAENKKQIAKDGGIAAILRAMESHKTSKGVQVEGCMALWNLACKNTVNKKQIAKEGGIAAILRAMELHKTSEGVQINGCWALQNLACKNTENKKQIAKDGGITAILRAMDSHKTSKGVQEQGCGALRSLVVNNAENQKRIAKEGGIAAILGVMESSLSKRVHQEGCWALRELAVNNTENQERIAKEGGITAVHRVMRLHKTCKDVQEHGIQLLKLLKVMYVHNQDQIATKSATENLDEMERKIRQLQEENRELKMQRLISNECMLCFEAFGTDRRKCTIVPCGHTMCSDCKADYESLTVASDTMLQRAFRVEYGGSPRRSIVAATIGAAVVTAILILAIQYLAPQAYTAECFDDGSLEPCCDDTDTEAVSKRAFKHVCGIGGSSPASYANPPTQGVTTMFVALYRYPLLLVNGLTAIVYHICEVVILKHSVGQILKVNACLGSTFLITPLVRYLVPLEDPAPIAPLLVLLAAVGATLSALSPVQLRQIANTFCPALATTEGNERGPRLLSGKAANGDKEASRGMASYGARPREKDDKERAEKNGAPLIVQATKLSAAFAAMLVASAMWAAMQRYAQVSCGVNHSGYVAIDQVVGGLYILLFVYVISEFESLFRLRFE